LGLLAVVIAPNRNSFRNPVLAVPGFLFFAQAYPLTNIASFHAQYPLTKLDENTFTVF
jgi:hypothetical protein